MLVDFQEDNSVYSIENEIMIRPGGFAFSGGEITVVNTRMDVQFSRI